jgi:hypothetical protein
MTGRLMSDLDCRRCQDPPLTWGPDLWKCPKCSATWDLKTSRAILRERGKSKIWKWLTT